MQSENKNPISIAMLFYVLTLAAIVASCAGRLSSDQEISKTTIAICSIVGGAVGIAIGFLGGAFYFKSVKATLVGVFVGGAIGVVAGVLTLLNDTHFLSNMTVAFGGCWLLVLSMLAKARFSGCSAASPIGEGETSAPDR